MLCTCQHGMKIRFITLLNPLKRLNICRAIVAVRRQHNIAVDDENQSTGPPPQTKHKKSNHNSSVTLISPRLSKSRLENIENVMSLVVSSQELSCVTMNKYRQLNTLVNIPFPKTNRSSRFIYFELLHPLLEHQSEVDLNIIELVSLPPKYDSINLHLKSISMLLFGMLEKDVKDPRVVFACRKKMGKMFDLNVEKTDSRKCSKSLVTEIISHQQWKETPIHVPSSILSERNDTTYYTDKLIQKLPNSAITPSTADALLQALGFWEYVKNLCSK